VAAWPYDRRSRGEWIDARVAVHGPATCRQTARSLATARVDR